MSSDSLDLGPPSRALSLVPPDRDSAHYPSTPQREAGKPRKGSPVRLRRIDRPGLTCFSCDEPAVYRVTVHGQPRESVCKAHGPRRVRIAKDSLGTPRSKPRAKRPGKLSPPLDANTAAIVEGHGLFIRAVTLGPQEAEPREIALPGPVLALGPQSAPQRRR
jgi:hypothetical protein